jgi:phenylalanyl-tRNA synthetase beta chain
MPTVTVRKHDLYHLAGLERGFGLAELEDKLALVKGELGARSRDGKGLRATTGDWLDSPEDDVLRIELADTNRPDLWCVEGIARHLRAKIHGPGQPYDFYTQTPGDPSIEVDPRLENVRPYVAGFLADGRELDADGLLAFIEAQETLTDNFGRKRKTVSIGLYRGEALAFPLEYRAVRRDEVAFEPLPPAGESAAGSWLEGQLLTPEEILQQHPTGREYAWILEGSVLVPLLADARGEVLSLPPIINSAHLGRVAPGLTALFVEVTGQELDQCLLALNILAANLADRGWSIHPVTARYPYETPRGQAFPAPYDLSLSQRVPLDLFERLLGEQLETAEILANLQEYGLQVMADGDEVVVRLPPYRQDYLHAVDVVEDFAISRGYHTFAPLFPAEFTVGKLDPLVEFEDLIRDLMIGYGFEEAVCNILTGRDQLRLRMEVGEVPADSLPPFHGGPAVAIENVMNRNYAVLRDWVLPSLLEVEARSASALYPHRIFEVGEVAVYDPAQNLGSRTGSRLAAVIAAEEVSFDSAQSVVYALLLSLDVPFTVANWEHPSFIPGRVAVVTSGETLLGFLGELSPQVLANWGARLPMAAFEIDLETLSQINADSC